MILAIVRKELRELLPLLAVVSIVQLYLLGCATGNVPEDVNIASQRNSIPFYNPFDSRTGMVIVVGGLFALLTGLWQTFSELTRGTFHFLLHRPLPRTSIFGAKLAVGAAASLAVTAFPLLVFALWAATPGTHPSPFFWSMTGLAWPVCLAMLLLYLAAFLSGLRSARWYGSRFWPVPLALFAAVVFCSIPASWFFKVLPLLIIGVAYLWAILHVACARDFS
ncbi:MAG TPA: ABC transporter permease subunit [Pirellulales bacterium]|nr:ABC transporter permease subunit [Pirellulales bacterium]